MIRLSLIHIYPACAARYNEAIIELMKRMAEIYEMNLEALNVEEMCIRDSIWAA